MCLLGNARRPISNSKFQSDSYYNTNKLYECIIALLIYSSRRKTTLDVRAQFHFRFLHRKVISSPRIPINSDTIIRLTIFPIQICMVASTIPPGSLKDLGTIGAILIMILVICCKLLVVMKFCQSITYVFDKQE